MKFAQIWPQQVLKCNIFVNIQKRPKNTKWPNYFIFGKNFQKRPNGNPDYHNVTWYNVTARKSG
jgi:hypothetical protein